MKKVLCFGDSNTFGFIPKTAQRYDENSRWSGILKKLAKDKFNVIEHGCNNRTCFAENPAGIEFCGYKYLPFVLDDSFDIVILSLGINDIQKFYRPNTEQIKKGLDKIISITKEKSPNAKIILMSPSKLTNNIFKGYFSIMFDEKSIEQSSKLADIFEDICLKNGCYFIDLNKIAPVSELDGVHYSVESHKKIANFVFDFLNEI